MRTSDPSGITARVLAQDYARNLSYFGALHDLSKKAREALDRPCVPTYIVEWMAEKAYELSRSKSNNKERKYSEN